MPKHAGGKRKPITDSDIRRCVKLRAAGKSIQQIADDTGWTRGQVRERFKAAHRVESSETVVATIVGYRKDGTGYKPGGDAKDREIIRLRDEKARLERELKEQHRSNIGESEVSRMLGVLASAPKDPPPWLVDATKRRTGATPEVPVCTFADWHAGEVVSRAELNGVNEYNMDIMEKRARRLVERVISLAKEYGPGTYPGAVVNLVGDFVSGGLHDELLKTDECEILPQVLRVRDVLHWALGQMADAFGHIYVPCVAGNHGRGTARPEFKRYVYKNFDWLIYKLLQRDFARDDRVQFDIRPSNEVLYRVFGQRYFLMHGDMLGVKGGDGIIGSIGPIMRGEVKVRGYADTARMAYDMLVLGHFHQELWLPRAIVSNCLKGPCEYGKNQLRASPSEPAQSLWFVHPRYGITSRWSVKVGDQPLAAGAAAMPWVSVFDPGKEAA